MNGITASNTPSPEIQQQLDHPVSPEGVSITWQHPFLVFLAEHGRIPPSEEAAFPAVLIPRPWPSQQKYLLEFFAYETIVKVS